MAIPDLLSELNDTCSLIALDALRTSDGEFLVGKGRRKGKGGGKGVPHAVRGGSFDLFD